MHKPLEELFNNSKSEEASEILLFSNFRFQFIGSFYCENE